MTNFNIQGGGLKLREFQSSSIQQCREVLASGKKRPIDRVLARVVVDESTGCWNFQGAKNEAGYGIVGLGDEGSGNDRAHRITYRHFIGETPKGMFVCHRCDNPSCCNPDHLFLGTPKDNHEDMVKKGRSAKPPRNLHDIGSYRYNAKLVESDVVWIREQVALGSSIYSMAKRFGMSQGAMQRVVHKKSWRHV